MSKMIGVSEKNRIPGLKKEIAEIETELRQKGSVLNERLVEFLNSRLSFLKDKLELLEKEE